MLTSRYVLRGDKNRCFMVNAIYFVTTIGCIVEGELSGITLYVAMHSV